MNVYLAQVNNRYGRNVFLPYSVGLLQAYAQQLPEIRENFDFKKLFFLKTDPQTVCEEIDDPKVFGFSNYIWNWEYNCTLASQVKERFPSALIVFGGPHVPNRSEGFFREHPFIDILVHGEGEVAFSEILLETLKPCPSFGNILGLSVQDRGETLKTPPRPRFLDLEKIPSPYLEGVFDGMMTDAYDFHASQETHRGCPYTCAFCDWGSSTMSKVRPFSDARLEKEMEWFAKKRIDLLYNCDANYGLFPRDHALTLRMAQIKKEYGFPKKFRAAYAKNSSHKIFEIAKILNDAEMCKGVTLSFQSLDETTLKAIRRSNIRIDDFRELMQKYRAENIPTYTEIIMGLPGETYDSFVEGLTTLVDAGQHESLNIYACAVLPNAELGDPACRRLHEIKTVRIPVLQHHSTPDPSGIKEYSDIIVSTKSMPLAAWEHAYVFSWALQTFHCLGITQNLAFYLKWEHGVSYRRFYELFIEYMQDHPELRLGLELRRIEGILANLHKGQGFEVVLPEWGNIIWPPEEASFLNLIKDKASLKKEISGFAKQILNRLDIESSFETIDELVTYQLALIIGPFDRLEHELVQRHDFHSYFMANYMGAKESLRKTPGMKIRIKAAKDYRGDLEAYAREVIWYGRKTGRFRHLNITKFSLSLPKMF